ncbi:MAG TPA: hypothetical protein VMF61_00545 [Candidatus Acidoferrales bacterium]|nr:hypothetical protein [Candidatus Acidoferrales bacterium]
MYKRVFFATLMAACALAPAIRADADPGMGWSQERAWLAANPFVLWKTISHGFDKSLGVSVGTANVKGGKRNWILHAVLNKHDVVTEETYTFAKGGSTPSLEHGNRASTILVRRMYEGEDVATEFAKARLVATVPIYDDPGHERFYAVKNGKFGFMLDPYEVVVFRAGELNVRIDQAKYCSTHKQCGE